MPIPGLGAKKGMVDAVHDLDLELARGEVFGFLGPNGAGKSTVMSLVAGIRRPTSGSVEVLGKDMAADGPSIRARIGLMPERPGCHERFRALEYVAYHAMFYGLGQGEAMDRASEILGRLGLEEELKRDVDKLSFGNQKKVSLAIAMVHDPELLLLDEPTTGLDPGSVVTFRDMVKDLKARGRTVFMSSHVLTEVEKLCDTVGIMVGGELKLKEDMKGLLRKVGSIEDGGGLEKVFLELMARGKGADLHG